MEELRNLKQLYSLAAGRFNQYDGKDFVLPQLFKDEVKEINSSTVTYNQYSAVIETRGNQNGVLNIYLPNQWFYIASYFTDLYNELQRYKKEALKIVSKDRLKELNGHRLTDDEMKRVDNLSIDNKSKKYLVEFMTNYSWWYGAKTIDRGDFYVSPILNSARLVNASQTYVADLCAFLSDKQNLVDAIIAGVEGHISETPKELLRQKAAATFLKKVMRLTLERDNNLSRLELLDKYEKTAKQLKINGFPLGRDKNQLPARLDDVDIDVAWSYNGQEYVLYLEWTQEMMENMFFSVYNEAYKGMFKMEKSSNGEYVLYEYTGSNGMTNHLENVPLQQIYYGAPGTGKSHKIKDIILEKGINEKEQVIRTTFHPDSDYSTFVGCYKPIMKLVPQTYVVEGKEKPVIDITTGKQSEKEEIVYDYTPQAFIQAYTKAWTTPDRPIILVIEEINRGNCAQIFGDIFQLLDRGDNGVSDYEIKPDKALQDYLRGYFGTINDIEIPERIKSGDIMKLPSNLYIWATMNTSDQSLFPIDSAFKRRWDWKYIKIKDEHKDWKVDVELKSKDDNGNETTKKVDWWEFVEKINKIIASMTSSADKQLGHFFCKATEIENGKTEPTIITKDTFVSKVIFYLWNDVFKDYGFEDASLFRYKEVNPATNKEEEKDLTFPDFYDEAGEEVNTVRLTDFVEKVLNWRQTIEEQK